MAEINRGLGVYRGIVSATAVDYKLPLLDSKHPITSIIFLYALNSEGRAVIHNFSFLSGWRLIRQHVFQRHASISKVIIKQNATLQTHGVRAGILLHLCIPAKCGGVWGGLQMLWTYLDHEQIQHL